MNVQTAGLEMDIYDGLFRQNGACGYVLKPDFLRDVQSSFHPERPISPFKAQTLLIQVPRREKPQDEPRVARMGSRGQGGGGGSWQERSG